MTKLLLAGLLLAVGCDSNGEEAWQRAARDYGLTSVQDDGVAILACGKDDSAWTSHKFTARNSSGHIVSGAVCCGLFFKGCTVRF